MNTIKVTITINKTESEEQLANSKFFGNPVFPKDFINNNIDDYDFYLAQINLTELAQFNTILPKEGMLYFFLNVETYPYQAKVFYSNDELYECIDNMNEQFEDMNQADILKMSFSDGDGDIQLLEELNEDSIPGYETEDYISILTIDAITEYQFPNLGSLDGYYYFIIKKEDLIKHDFSKVKFIAYES